MTRNLKLRSDPQSFFLYVRPSERPTLAEQRVPGQSGASHWCCCTTHTEQVSGAAAGAEAPCWRSGEELVTLSNGEF